MSPMRRLQVQLFQQLPSILVEFKHGTSSIGNLISFPFHGVQERSNCMSYVTWVLVLMWTAPV
jgi:hypothetical protein